MLIRASANAAVVIQNCVRFMMSIFLSIVVVCTHSRPRKRVGYQRLIRQVWSRMGVLDGGPRARSPSNE